MPQLDIQTFSLHPEGGEQVEQENCENVPRKALEALRPCLPVSLPLYRRLQFGRFFEATSLLTNLSLRGHGAENDAEAKTNQKDGEDNSDKPWLIAFVDRSCRPETEVWLYASWESTPSDKAPSFGAGGTEETLIRNLITAMKAMPIPESIHQDILNAKAARLEQDKDSTTDSVGLNRDDYAAHMLDSSIMLWGSTHERTLALLQALGVAGGEKFKAAAMPNLMFTWDVDTMGPQRELPSELRWGQLSPEHFALVRSRTQIPRQDRTLAVLPNLGIFPAEKDESSAKPVAWVFVGLDGSLTTLHVEPEWRGHGLAKAITTRLFQEKMVMFWESGLTKLAHGYVIRGNKESEGMCRSLKGRADWDVYWVRVDLDAV